MVALPVGSLVRRLTNATTGSAHKGGAVAIPGSGEREHAGAASPAPVLGISPEAAMRRPPYAHEEAAAFVGACLLLGGALGVLWVRFRM